jgi:hypothetical protein
VSKNKIEKDDNLNGKKIGIILALALVGWTICGMIMGLGLATTTEFNAIIIHALMVPFVFSAVGLLYFNKFNYTTPLGTAAIFVVFVILMDFFVVSIMINKNFDMFKSFLGTWFVFAEIFLVTYLTGTLKSPKDVSIKSGTTRVHIN